MHVHPYVKTSLAPGSRVVMAYFEAAGLVEPLDALGFNLVGYGCTTCIGNSGPLPEAVATAITEGKLIAAGVLSGNRNFEGRIHSLVKANYLASPPLVVAYALAGTVDIDLDADPIGQDRDGQDVFLKDLWPSQGEIQDAIRQAVRPEQFKALYDGIEDSNPRWNAIETAEGAVYDWQDDSTYIQEPPFFQDLDVDPQPIGAITGARVLALLGDSVTTDHISPAGAIPASRARGPVPPGRGRRARRLQLVRLAPRQRPRDDARHVRQHPPQEPARAGHRGRPQRLPPDRRAGLSLRRRRAVQGGRDAAARHRRVGLRHGVLARLGREGHDPARREGRPRDVVRAHPPRQPRRHGRAAADVPRRRVARDVRPRRDGDLRRAGRGRV